MSLLLDALKRAEEAKRAKAESGQSDDAPGAQAPLDLDGTGASAPVAPAAAAKASALSLEEPVSPSARDTNTVPTAPAAPVEDARGTVNATAPAVPLTLEQMIESELGPQQKPLVTSVSSATAAFRAARIGAKKQPSAELELAPTAAASAPAAESSTADVDAKRRAINNAFAVKHAQAASGSRPGWLLPLVAVCIAGVAAGGWYVWQEINKVSRPAAAARSPAPAPAPVPPTTVASGVVTKAPAIAAPDGTPANTSAAEPPKDQAEAPLPPLLPPQSEAPLVTPSATAATARAKGKEVTETPREVVARKVESLPEPPPPRRVQLTLAKPTEQKPPSAPTSVGYAALLAGDWAAAKRSYAEAIAANPNDIDAHLGFATALARSGSGRKPEELGLAAKHYRRVLELDPRNAVASAALVAIESEFMPRGAGGSGRAATESELRIIVSQDPSNAAAQFLLGNVYAETRRWTEAQQAYFEAARLSPRNPDYLYNLAVSLDQLGQSRTALDFYRRALGVGAGGQFDRTQVERRIRTLSETATPAEKIEPAAR